MATNGQLRAALAILHADTDAVEEQVWQRTMTGVDSTGVEHAMLAGLLYRVVGAELRDSLAGAPDVGSLEDRARAAGPSAVTVRGEDLYGQAHFEAYWLTDRIAELYGELDSAPPPLAAAAYTAEVTRTLLRIHRDLLEKPGTGAAHPGWESILDQLERARALARAAHAAGETIPQRNLGRPPVFQEFPAAR
ncbi:hypothetical protein [Nocardia macrotermitis]|uniref:Uncharacterized protein n=1 Tax=Nocardia macrotermitis TaxID=2585198 RepID=A0A7K0D1X4_9NOCA|nr:hypothetical protein [Nocardia macrotermitis]MQY19730.1 hypothetical protein [Nocardia macrotermitis]